MGRTRTVMAAAVGAALLIGLAGCGGSTGEELAAVGGPASSSGSTAGTTSPAPPSSPGPSSSASALPGTHFIDPDGQYTFTVGTGWKKDTKITTGQQWIVGATQNTVKPKVLITTEDLTNAGTVTASSYLQLSVKNLKKAGHTVVRTGSVTGNAGQQLGAIEWTDVLPANPKQRYRVLVLFDLNTQVAAVVSMIAADQAFPKDKSRILPYLKTIKVS